MPIRVLLGASAVLLGCFWLLLGCLLLLLVCFCVLLGCFWLLLRCFSGASGLLLVASGCFRVCWVVFVCFEVLTLLWLVSRMFEGV